MNLMLGIEWARKMTKEQERTGNLGIQTWWGRNIRSTSEPIILETMTYQTATLTRTSCSTFDNDAQACFDRVMPNLFNLHSKQLGVPQDISNSFTKHLQHFNYAIKTSMEESINTYCNTKETQLFGVGQGGGALMTA